MAQALNAYPSRPPTGQRPDLPIAPLASPFVALNEPVRRWPRTGQPVKAIMPPDRPWKDEWLLKLARWRVARARQQKNWAEHQAATMWGTLPDNHSPELDLSPLERMKELENLFAEIGKPRTMLLARELLGVCVTILAHAHEDPESTFAQGPVLEILRNVLNSLDWCKAEMEIGPAAPCLIE